MTPILLLTILTADPQLQPAKIPENIRAYFQAADDAKAAGINTLKERISDTQVEINGEPNKDRKALLSKQLKLVKDQLERAQKTKPTAYLPNKPKAGNVGLLEPSTIKAVFNNTTAIVVTHNDMKAVLLTNTKGLFKDQPYNSTDLWEVTTDTTYYTTKPKDMDENLHDQITRKTGRAAGCYFCKPIPAADVKYFRELHDAEKQKGQVK